MGRAEHAPCAGGVPPVDAGVVATVDHERWLAGYGPVRGGHPPQQPRHGVETVGPQRGAHGRDRGQRAAQRVEVRRDRHVPGRPPQPQVDQRSQALAEDPAGDRQLRLELVARPPELVEVGEEAVQCGLRGHRDADHGVEAIGGGSPGGGSTPVVPDEHGPPVAAERLVDRLQVAGVAADAGTLPTRGGRQVTAEPRHGHAVARGDQPGREVPPRGRCVREAVLEHGEGTAVVGEVAGPTDGEDGAVVRAHRQRLVHTPPPRQPQTVGPAAARVVAA